LKIFTENQVRVATFLGSPLAGGILMAHNAKVCDQRRAPIWFLVISACATALFIGAGIGVGILLHGSRGGDVLLPLVAMYAMQYWYRNVQGELLAAGKYPGAVRASWWTATGVAVSTSVCLCLLVIGIALFVSSSARSQTSKMLVYSPSPTNGKEVIESGWNSDQLGHILTDFQRSYRTSLGNDFSLDVRPRSDGAISIKFPHDIPPIIFTYLVNYVRYPRGFDLNARKMLVVGLCILSADFQAPHQNLVGKNVLFYVPENDQAFNLVYAKLGQETFEISFITGSWRKVNDSRLPPGIEMLL
jgi:hypothetical protein